VITATASSGISASCTITVNSLSVSQVLLNKYEIVVDEGKSASIKASVLPKKARYKTVSWTSSDPTIAEVTAKGSIKTYRAGVVTITATAHNGVSASCTLTVRSLAVSQVSLSKSSLTLVTGKSASIKAIIAPKNARVKTVAWSSSNPAVASVSAKGKVIGIAPGTCTITATAHNGVSASCIVTVTEVFVSRVTLKRTDMFKLGAGLALKASISPSKAWNKTVTWVSSNPAVAIVNDAGWVQSVSTGTAVITVTAVDGSKADTCKVTVYPR
jgi:uncharacterized protein YjdB